jgi:hypothetical protein
LRHRTIFNLVRPVVPRAHCRDRTIETHACGCSKRRTGGESRVRSRCRRTYTVDERELRYCLAIACLASRS